MAKDIALAPSVKQKTLYCGCKGKPSDASEYQDLKYGKGYRVHTIGGTKDKPHFTCTVCGKER